eukprot:1594990-Amphidinium_carterae.1
MEQNAFATRGMLELAQIATPLQITSHSDYSSRALEVDAPRPWTWTFVPFRTTRWQSCSGTSTE